MTNLRPFRALRFDPANPDWQEQFNQIKNQPRLADDRSQFVKYARAAQLLGELRKSNVITQDAQSQIHKTNGWTIGLAPVDQVQVTENIQPRDFQDALRLVESTNTWLSAQPVILNPNPNGPAYLAIGSHQIVAAAIEFSENARNPARKWFPVAIMEPSDSGFPCRRRCISSQRIAYEDVRLRLAEQFDLLPLPTSRPMDKNKPEFRFLLSDPHGLIEEARVKDDHVFTAGVIDDQVRPDVVTMLEKGVIQGMLGQAAADFTLGNDEPLIDIAATQLILESMSLGDFVSAVEGGRVMPAESLDFAPIIPTGALMWSLQDFDA